MPLLRLCAAGPQTLNPESSSLNAESQVRRYLHSELAEGEADPLVQWCSGELAPPNPRFGVEGFRV